MNNHPSHLIDSELERQTRAAWLYFIQGLTQQEIAERMGVNRIKVTRLLQQARANGLVTITINSPAVLNMTLQEELCRRFGLRNALVTFSPQEENQLLPMLANAAAAHLAAELRPGMSVGIGNGRTVSLMPEFFQPGGDLDCTFIELTGGPPGFYLGTFSSDATYRLASRAGGQALHINTPYFVENREARDILLRDPAVAQALERARSCDLAYLSVGAFGTTNLLTQYGILKKTEAARLMRAGVVGDLLGRLLDESGGEISYSLGDRLIGLSLPEIDQLTCCVLVSGGMEKIKAILAVLYAGHADVLITDADTAEKLLEEKKRGVHA